MSEFDDAINKVVEDINSKRRQELLELKFNDTSFKKYIRELRKAPNRKNKANWKRVASMPVEVDKFFTDIYGKDYYKDKDFFKKYAPEWITYED